MRRTFWQQWSGILFAVPWLLQFVLFILVPFAASLWLSLTDYRFRGFPRMIWFENYIDLASDEVFIKSIFNTLYYTAFHVPGVMIVSFFIAILLNQKVQGMPLFRTLFYLPTVTAGVATAMLWLVILQPTGILNQALGLVGIPRSPMADVHAVGDAGSDHHELLDGRHDHDSLLGRAAGDSAASL